jgi:hypothetical protein
LVKSNMLQRVLSWPNAPSSRVIDIYGVSI